MCEKVRQNPRSRLAGSKNMGFVTWRHTAKGNGLLILDFYFSGKLLDFFKLTRTSLSMRINTVCLLTLYNPLIIF